MKQSKRLLSLLLSASLATGMLPAVALADEVDDTQIISVDEEQIAEDVAEASESQDAIVVEDGSEDAAEAESEESVVDSEEVQSITVDDAAAEVQYVMLNIPYAAFYKADVNVANNADVDAFTSATLSKTRTASLVAGSYHPDETGASINGVTFPVKLGEGVTVADLQALGGTVITDDSSVTITVTNRGKTTTETYKGQDALFEAPDYSYYVMTDAPSYYKEVTKDADENLTFGAIHYEAAVQSLDVTYDFLSTTTYGDYELDFFTDEAKETGLSFDKVYAVVVETKEGHLYGMRHMENIWRNELAWCVGYTEAVHNCPTSSKHYEDMQGETITGVTYYTSEGAYKISMSQYVAPYYTGTISAAEKSTTEIAVSDLPTDIENATASVSYTVGSGKAAQTITVAEKVAISNGTIALEDAALIPTTEYTVVVQSENYADISTSFTSKDHYVLMNIPYAAFYKADVNVANNADVDAFTSATLNKTRTASLVAGSYHPDETGASINGVTFPVKLGEGVTGADIASYTQITDSSSVDITVTNRGQTSTVTYKGQDALFEASDYSYYVLSEEPTYYKEVTKDADGNLTFGAIHYDAAVQSLDVTYDFLSTTTYGDYELDFFTDEAKETGLSFDKVYAVVVETKEGHLYGMRHMENIWRNELAWCVGYTEAVHNCPTSSKHYEGMQGETITGVTYYTSEGAYKISMNQYVAPYYTGTISAAEKSTTEIAVSGLPTDVKNATASVSYTVGSGRNAQTVTVAEKATISNGTITLKDALLPVTTYTVVVQSENYADMSASFTSAKENQSVTVSKDSISMTYGDKAVALGASAKTALTYESSNKSVATVDANGNVTAVGAGTATITIKAAASDTIAEASKTVTVTVAAAAQTISGTSSYSKTYSTTAFSLDAKTNGNGKLTYASSNTAVATVDAAGKVTLKGKGTATITVKAAATSQYKEASKTVTVTVAAATQTITTGSASYSKAYGNAAFSLGAKTSGNGALTYTSSKSSVATVSSAGKVTIKGVGTATITIKAAGTNQYNAASKTVKVTVAKGTSTITAKSYTKAYGAKAFKLGAKNSGNGKLTYTSSNKKVATVSSAGKITIKGVGKATITIKAAGTTKYKAASKKVTITVNPAKTSISNLKNVKGKKMTAKWAKKSSATGYQIYYSTSSSFKTYKKTTSTSASKTISGLTKGKTYYVKVRGYKKVSGKTYYASWSTSKKVKITK
ncbi:MAG: Ig-like domain-containing protein [Eubacteriales bacterium]|nr:Ig-like domain-containing protein [Eubacteriales bacterium]